MNVLFQLCYGLTAAKCSSECVMKASARTIPEDLHTEDYWRHKNGSTNGKHATEWRMGGTGTHP